MGRGAPPEPQQLSDPTALPPAAARAPASPGGLVPPCPPHPRAPGRAAETAALRLCGGFCAQLSAAAGWLG